MSAWCPFHKEASPFLYENGRWVWDWKCRNRELLEVDDDWWLLCYEMELIGRILDSDGIICLNCRKYTQIKSENTNKYRKILK